MTSRTRTARGTTFGGFAFACLGIAALSGVALALPFDVARPYDSVALILLTNPGARFFRNVHYWAGHLFLVLTMLHVWDHLRQGTERRVRAGMWARLTLSIPVAAFLMLSGFILRADGEGLQALRIVSALLGQIPLAGHTLSMLVVGGRPDNFQLIYVHHVATATILTWLIVGEHARAFWPKALPVLASLAAVAILGAFVGPVLHDGLDPLVRGPWYFLALQEALHWLAQPTWVTTAIAAVLVTLLFVPRLSSDRAIAVKRWLAAVAALYLAVTAFALLFRGENWSLITPSVARLSGVSIESVFTVPAIDVVRSRAIPVVLGRREGCLFCHADVRGLSASHRPDAVGCASCHRGNPFTLDKAAAHRLLIAIPGNLGEADRTCGLAQCHPDSSGRVRQSIMVTMSGIVAVDRAVFGETAAGVQHIDELKQSAADTHLRQLCASCHVGARKETFGAIGEASRGGGCNACHLRYDRNAADWLAKYARDRAIATVREAVHPNISVRISNDHCFGCHSRSGRISTSYEGWAEVRTVDSPGVRKSGSPEVEAESSNVTGAARRRILADGRTLTYVSADVHHEKGMLCVDCHTAREVMGDGHAYTRKSAQTRVRCEDCHGGTPTGPAPPAVAASRDRRAVGADRIDAISRRALGLRDRLAEASGWSRRLPADRLLATLDGSDVMINTRVDASGNAWLSAKANGRLLPLRRPVAACVQGRGHARLSCASCHTAWAPRCTGCHTSFNRTASAFDHLAQKEVEGAWVETGSDYEAAAPTLGLRIEAGAAGRPEVVDTFVPGMVMTLDRTGAGGRSPGAVFRRLYARASAHTTMKASRSCKSCHNDPLALGYGRGVLTYDAAGRWHFVPDRAPSPYDRLPADAWTGFLQTRTDTVSTGNDVRPFNEAEQKRILTVGACLTCHEAGSAALRGALDDFERALRRASPKCVLPRWD